MSYLSTKRFLDKQIQTLDTPLELSESILNLIEQSVLTPEQVQQVIDSTNLKIRHHNRRVFPPQATHMVAEQVLQLETDKLARVSEQLLRANALLTPLLVPGFQQVQNMDHTQRVGLLGDLIAQLPDSKYLIVEPQDTDKDIMRVVLENASREAHLLHRYDAIKADLVAAHKRLEYALAKRDYIGGLASQFRQTFGFGDEGDDSDVEESPDVGGVQLNIRTSTKLTDEINRFRVLVEKVGFNGERGDVRGAIHEINSAQ